MHVFGSTRLAERLKELKELRPRIEVREAADVIGLLTDPECFGTLVQRYGWTFDRAEAWVTSALTALLLK